MPRKRLTELEEPIIGEIRITPDIRIIIQKIYGKLDYTPRIKIEKLGKHKQYVF